MQSGRALGLPLPDLARSLHAIALWHVDVHHDGAEEQQRVACKRLHRLAAVVRDGAGPPLPGNGIFDVYIFLTYCFIINCSILLIKNYIFYLMKHILIFIYLFICLYLFVGIFLGITFTLPKQISH